MTHFINDKKLDFSDVLIVPQRSTLTSRKEVSLERTFTFKHSKRTWTGIPIIAANMTGVGTFDVAKTLSTYHMMTAVSKHYDIRPLVNHFNSGEGLDSSYSLGTTQDDLDKFNRFKIESTARFVTIDVANFYTEASVDFLKRFRDDNPKVTIFAGNVATPEMASQLILNGADGVKVGIGSGNACSTRIKTGVGYPQLSAVIECANAVHGLGGVIISDGGITCPGDMCKAFGANADFVMAGSVFAGHDQGGGKVYVKDEKEWVEFYGMSSKLAQEKHGDGLKEYRASEGRVLSVPYKGDLNLTVRDYLGSIRSFCTYIGASSLKEASKRTTFILVNNQISALYGIGRL